jgi:hypothetical protein
MRLIGFAQEGILDIALIEDALTEAQEQLEEIADEEFHVPGNLYVVEQMLNVLSSGHNLMDKSVQKRTNFVIAIAFQE